MVRRMGALLERLGVEELTRRAKENADIAETYAYLTSLFG
jgi:hypothetical protein